MRTQVLLPRVLVSVAAILAGCGEAAVPARPSWDQDVLPILQGSCNHCHGETVGRPEATGKPLGRLDICDLQPFTAAQITAPNTTVDVKAWAQMFEMRLKPAAGKSRPNMPPAPAAPLSDYEIEVLTKWATQLGRATAPAAGEIHPSCRKQVRNRLPVAKLISKKADDGKLVVVIDVSDVDGDQVLGKVSAGSGGSTQVIPGTGRRTFEFAGQEESTEVKVVVLDGYDDPVDFTF